MTVVLAGQGAAAPTVSYCSHPGVFATRSGAGQYTLNVPACARVVVAGYAFQKDAALLGTDPLLCQIGLVSAANGTLELRTAEADTAVALAELPVGQTLSIDIVLLGAF